MKTVIHIGQHKTGTTSIQHFLQDHRPVLEKHGVYVPQKIAGVSHPSHFILNVYALAENRFSSKKEELLSSNGPDYLVALEEILKTDIARIYKDASQKKCNTVIWSNEGLYLLNSADEYNRLIGLFRDHSSEVVAVCCFRDVAAYRESYISQLERQGLALSDDPDSYRYIETDSWLFDYERKKRLLSELFDDTIFFPYDPANNIRQFLKAIHLDTVPIKRYRLNVNRSNLLIRTIKRFSTWWL